MIVKLLHTDGSGQFYETDWDKPEITENEIEVKAVMTGVCRSDIDMMNGNFGPLPLSMQGHEGLGLVTKVGANITGVAVGDYVATRGEPAYADYYNVRKNEFVRVPEAHPRYILEPVACGINVVTQALNEIGDRCGPKKRLLILGSGFLAWIAYNTLKLQDLSFGEVVVVGNSNKELWGDKLNQHYEGTFDVVIDLSSKNDVFDLPIVNSETLIIFAAQKKVTTDFGNLLWKACTIVFPSPRTKKFHEAMRFAAQWIEDGRLNVDKFWTKGYNRNTEWSQAFEDGQKRANGYSRGYICY
jgi:D-arabinose 1-dehydrogenase-like Zn-dependent alcohol dehydrogenase